MKTSRSNTPCLVALTLTLLLAGCSSKAVQRAPATGATTQRAPLPGTTVEADYLSALNAAAAAALQQAGAGINREQSAATATLLSSKENHWPRIAIRAVVQHDFEHRQLLLPVWSRISRLTRRQTGIKRGASAGQLHDFYEQNSDEAQDLLDALVDGFLEFDIFLNFFVTPADPVFLLPLTEEPLRPGRQASDALRAVFGEDVDAGSIAMRSVDGVDTENSLSAGMTINGTAVINEPWIRNFASELDASATDVREVVVANEAAHIVLEQRFGPLFARNWPMEKLTQAMGSPFTLKSIHVEEFLSDAVSVQTNWIGPVLNFSGLFLGSVSAEEGLPASGNPDSRYGFTAEFFLRELERAGIDDANSSQANLAAQVRAAAGRGDIESGSNLLLTMTPGTLDHIKAAYLEMGRKVLALLRYNGS